jgi:hypothetical protein
MSVGRRFNKKKRRKGSFEKRVIDKESLHRSTESFHGSRVSFNGYCGHPCLQDERPCDFLKRVFFDNVESVTSIGQFFLSVAHTKR